MRAAMHIYPGLFLCVLRLRLHETVMHRSQESSDFSVP